MGPPSRRRLLLICATALLFAAPAHAINLNGAWANDASACDKVFARKGGKISVSKNADSYGSGFVIDGNRIRGKVASCTITSRKEDGATVQLIAACSTDVALSPTQFSLKVEDDNRITRLFPGIAEMSTPYVRCKP